MANIGDIFFRALAEFDDAQVTKSARRAGDLASKSFGVSLKAGIGQALQDFGNDTQKFGKKLSGVGDAMTRNVTLPILAAGAATGKLALDFDTTMRQIVGLAKVPRDQIEGVRDDILEMAGEIGRSPQELAEAFYFVASAGFSANEAMDVLETSAKAAASGMGQTQDVAKVLGGVINAYGHENISAAHAADVLTAAVQDGSAEASDFAGVIGTVVPTAAALGVSFDQVTAALSGMTLTGTSVDEAATQLTQVFSGLLKPTAQAEDAMKGLGLSSAGLRQELKEKGLLATLRTLEERFQGNDTAAAAVFGNIRALRGITGLLSLDTDQLNGIFADTAGALGVLQQAYDDTDGPQRQLDKDLAELQATAIEIGEDVLPVVVAVLHEIAGGAKEVGKWWRSLDDDTKHAVVQWAAFLAIAGPVLSITGKIVTTFGGLTKGLGWMIKNLPILNKLVIGGSTGWLGWAAAAIAAGVAAQNFANDTATAIYNALSGGQDQLSDASQKLGLSVDKTVFVLGDIADAAKNAGLEYEDVKQAIFDAAAAGEDWRALLERLKSGQQTWVGSAKTAVDGAVSAFDRGAATMNGTVSGYSAGVKQTVAATGQAIETMTDEQIQAAKDAHDAVLKSITDLFHDITTVLTNREQFDKEWQAFLDELEHPFTSTQRRMAIEAQLGSKKLQEGLTNKDPQIKADAIQRVNDLIGQYNLIAPGALAAGELVNPKLKKGIDSNVSLATKAAEDTAHKAGLALNQPDEWTAAGLGNIDAYITGQQAHDAHVKQAATATAVNAARAAANQKPAFRGAGFTAAGGFNDGLTDGTADAHTWGGNVARAWVQGIIDAMKAHGSSRQAIANAARLATLDLRGYSPPKSGPLQDIDKWGANVGMSWTDALRSAIGALDLSSTLSGIASGLSGVRAGFGALSPSYAVAGASAAAGASPASSVGPTTIYQLYVNGVPRSVSTRDQMIRELDQMDVFGGARIG